MSEFLINPQTTPTQDQLSNIINSANQHRSLKLSEKPSEICPKCGSKLFTEAFVIKDIPGIEVGAIGKEKIPMPIEQYSVLVCAKCGEIAPAMFYDVETKAMVEKLLGEKFDDNGNIIKEEIKNELD